MILKVRDEQDFNISMNLNINYELEYIELTVNVWNKKAHTQQTKTFTASLNEKAARRRQKIQNQITSRSQPLNRSTPATIAVALTKRTKQRNSATSRIKN